MHLIFQMLLCASRVVLHTTDADLARDVFWRVDKCREKDAQ